MTKVTPPGSGFNLLSASAVSGGLYYYATGSDSIYSLYRSDGTAEGTFALLPEKATLSLLPLRGGLLFTGTDSTHGTEPWFTDGTVAGTHLVADLAPGTDGSMSSLSGVVSGDVAWLAARIGGQSTIVRTDGTAAGTATVSLPMRYDSVGRFTAALGGNVFSVGESQSAGGFDLLRIDGTSAAVVTHAASQWPIYGMFSTGRTLFVVTLRELWRSDGTAAGTFRLDGAVMPECFERSYFAVDGGTLY